MNMSHINYPLCKKGSCFFFVFWGVIRIVIPRVQSTKKSHPTPTPNLAKSQGYKGSDWGKQTSSPGSLTIKHLKLLIYLFPQGRPHARDTSSHFSLYWKSNNSQPELELLVSQAIPSFSFSRFCSILDLAAFCLLPIAPVTTRVRQCCLRPPSPASCSPSYLQGPRPTTCTFPGQLPRHSREERGNTSHESSSICARRSLNFWSLSLSYTKWNHKTCIARLL